MAEDAEARRQLRKEWARRRRAELRAKQRESRAAAEPTESMKQRDACRNAEQKAKRKAAREERAAFNKRLKERLANERRAREQEQARTSRGKPASRRVEPDPFPILGLSRGATREQVKAAYRELALQHHPDRPGGDAAKFTEVNDAYLRCLKISGLSLVHPA